MDETINPLLDGARGIYIPQAFAECFVAADWGIEPEDETILLEGPDAEYYWEVWDRVESDACYTDPDGYKWSLYQQDDLFAVREDHNWEAP